MGGTAAETPEHSHRREHESAKAVANGASLTGVIQSGPWGRVCCKSFCDEGVKFTCATA
jgi:hypothetical protein